jgi:hypothetical protein
MELWIDVSAFVSSIRFGFRYSIGLSAAAIFIIFSSNGCQHIKHHAIHMLII